MKRLALLLWCLWALPALATQDAWPAFYDVTGVAADDVLNIRERPDAGAPIIGTLAPHARNIEVIAPNPRETWAMINTGERAGWVSLRYLARQPGQFLGAALPVASCFGTEPFWSLAFEETTVRLSPLGEEDLSGQITARLSSPDRRDEEALILTLMPAGSATAILRRASCSDGMSDRQYGIATSLITDRGSGPVLLSGCCTISK